METILIQAESKKAKALKQFLKAFGIAFKIEKTAKVEEYNTYDPSFVKKILERSENAKKGIPLLLIQKIYGEF